MNLVEFTDSVMHAQQNSPEQRYGQVLFNALYAQKPELAEQIRGTEADPFHADDPLDERVSNFWNVIYHDFLDSLPE